MKQTDREALNYIQGGLEMYRSICLSRTDGNEFIDIEFKYYVNTIRDMLAEGGDSDDETGCH